jgi:uncharacterized membrane protein YhaH (DUF805 family)
MGFLKGRLDRRRYWASLAAVVVVCAASAPLLKLSGGVAALLLWAAVAAPRLHDVGRSGWWGAGLLVFNAGALMAASMVGILMVGPILYLCALLIVVFSLWLGIAEGEATANRFGPPPQPAQHGGSGVQA